MGRKLPEAQGHNVYEKATYFLVFLFGEVALVCSGRSAHDLIIFSSAWSVQSLPPVSPYWELTNQQMGLFR